MTKIYSSVRLGEKPGGQEINWRNKWKEEDDKKDEPSDKRCMAIIRDMSKTTRGLPRI